MARGKFALIATAAQAARSYAQKNPDKTDRYLSKAADFADKRTKGKYSKQITGAASKARGALGNGRPQG